MSTPPLRTSPTTITTTAATTRDHLTTAMERARSSLTRQTFLPTLLLLRLRTGGTMQRSSQKRNLTSRGKKAFISQAFEIPRLRLGGFKFYAKNAQPTKKQLDNNRIKVFLIVSSSPTHRQKVSSLNRIFDEIPDFIKSLLYFSDPASWKKTQAYP